MLRRIVVFACLLAGGLLGASDDAPSIYPRIDYQTAYSHELKPHRRAIPHEGVDGGHDQLSLTLIVSATGDVMHARASGDDKILRFWPDLQNEVYQWKFTPFEVNGKASTVEVEEYLNLLPPERLPRIHVPAPSIRPDSEISIALARSGCFGTCPAYSVTVSTRGIVFVGGSFVVAAGRHTDTVDPDAVRELARKFVAADFYSMADSYVAGVTDCPTYTIRISIDGHEKKVVDYVGTWVGMPEAIADLEEEVDAFARTERWIKGNDGLVPALQAEGYNFKSLEAQTIVKEAASRGEIATVSAMLDAGVPFDPLPAPGPGKPAYGSSVADEGWLQSASSHPDALATLMQAGASKDDQNDKNRALAGAAYSGSLEAVRALIAYGANPNADLNKPVPNDHPGRRFPGAPGTGSVLIDAAYSGNPDVVREILRHHPDLEAHDPAGATAIFAIGDSRGDREDDRVRCMRLLVAAGANVNARDNDGNTALHKIFLTAVAKELLKDGADVNARNNNGETPIFTTFSDQITQLLIDHGADLSIRNNKGQTVLDATAMFGSGRAEIIRQALQAQSAK